MAWVDKTDVVCLSTFRFGVLCVCVNEHGGRDALCTTIIFACVLLQVFDSTFNKHIIVTECVVLSHKGELRIADKELESIPSGKLPLIGLFKHIQVLFLVL